MSEAEQLALRFSTLAQQVSMMADQSKTDHDLIIDIHRWLESHIKRFEEHVILDDKRELEELSERKLIAEKLSLVTSEQAKVMAVYSTRITMIAIFLPVVLLLVTKWMK